MDFFTTYLLMEPLIKTNFSRDRLVTYQLQLACFFMAGFYCSGLLQYKLSGSSPGFRWHYSLTCQLIRELLEQNQRRLAGKGILSLLSRKTL
jgi:hypothetical protein